MLREGPLGECILDVEWNAARLRFLATSSRFRSSRLWGLTSQSLAVMHLPGRGTKAERSATRSQPRQNQARPCAGNTRLDRGPTLPRWSFRSCLFQALDPTRFFLHAPTGLKGTRATATVLVPSCKKLQKTENCFFGALMPLMSSCSVQSRAGTRDPCPGHELRDSLLHTAPCFLTNPPAVERFFGRRTPKT